MGYEKIWGALPPNTHPVATSLRWRRRLTLVSGEKHCDCNAWSYWWQSINAFLQSIFLPNKPEDKLWIQNHTKLDDLADITSSFHIRMILELAHCSYALCQWIIFFTYKLSSYMHAAWNIFIYFGRVVHSAVTIVSMMYGEKIQKHKASYSLVRIF